MSTEVSTRVLTEGIDPFVDALLDSAHDPTLISRPSKVYWVVAMLLMDLSTYQCSLVLLWTFLAYYTIAILKVIIYLPLKNPIITI